MPTSPTERPDVIAAGAVVMRPGGEVLLVHRPRYDDWSFPKGKLDRGESIAACAVREVEEETGVRIRLGVPLDSQRYRLANGRFKTVHYWVGRVEGDDDVTAYEPNDEIDRLEWLPWEQARTRLSYAHDRLTLDEAHANRTRTRTLVVLRHAHARARSSWPEDDRLRPLLASGTAQAQRLVPLLQAYGLTTVATSTSTRCVQTVTPYADLAGRPLQRYVELSEEDASPRAVATVVAQLVDENKRVLLCTHRPVLPWVWQALGLPDEKLEPGGMAVIHHRRGRILASELYGVR